MLIDACDRIRKFINFINEKNLTNVPCEISLLVAHDTVACKDDIAFAVYLPENKAMYVAGDMTCLLRYGDLQEDKLERVVLEHVAHEYVHHLQYVEKREFNEEEAEQLSRKLVDEYLL